MKKLLCALILLIATLSVKAQDRQSLEEGALKMLELTAKGDFDELMNYTYPKVFTIASREEISKALKNALQGDGVTAEVVPGEANFTFSEIKKIDKSYYSIIGHDLIINMTFEDEIADEDLPRTLYELKETLGTRDITYDKLTKTLRIKKRAHMVAIADELTKYKWTYINNDGGPLIKKLLPKKHMAALGLK